MTAKSSPQRAGGIWLWVAFGSLAFASVLYGVFPKPDASARLAGISYKDIGYTGVELPFSQEEKEFLGPAQATKRRYRHGDTTLVMIVIDGTENRHVVHDPSFCYRGAGLSVMKQESFPLLNGEGVILTVGKGDQSAEIAYWFSDGEHRFSGFTEYIVRSALSRLSFGKIWQQPLMVTLQVETAPQFDWAAGVDKFPFLLDF